MFVPLSYSIGLRGTITFFVYNYELVVHVVQLSQCPRDKLLSISDYDVTAATCVKFVAQLAVAQLVCRRPR